jgi:hypothetical protein
VSVLLREAGMGLSMRLLDLRDPETAAGADSPHARLGRQDN